MYYYVESHGHVPPTLDGWWHTLSVIGTIIGTIISTIFLMIDCCCSCRLNDEKFVKDHEEQELWACTGHWVFLATLCKDLPLMILSFVPLHQISSDQLCESSEDMLLAFKLSSTLSLAASLIRLIKVCIFNVNCDGCVCPLVYLYVTVSILSIVVFLYASNVCTPAKI